MGLKPPIVARAVVPPTDLTLVSSPGEESNQKLVGAAPGTYYMKEVGLSSVKTGR